MSRVQPWTEAQLMEQEQIFERKVSLAVRATVGKVVREYNAGVLTAAAAQQVDYAAVENTVIATWNGYVEEALFPFLTATFLESAERVVEGVEGAAGVAVEGLTNTYAQEFLQYARNRMVAVGEQLWENIRTQLQEGYAAGESVEQVAARLSTVAGLSTPRALVTARTELVSAANAGSYLQMLASGLDATKTWLATMDPRTRESHRHADEQDVPLTDTFTVDIYNGDVKTGTEGLEFPGDPIGTPGNVINCRCSLAFDFSEDEDEGALVAAKFVEIEHPRDKDGKFKKKGAPDTYVKIPDVTPKASDPDAVKTAWIIKNKWSTMAAGQKAVLIKSITPDTWKKLPPEQKNTVLSAPDTTSHPDAKHALEKAVNDLAVKMPGEIKAVDDADGPEIGADGKYVKAQQQSVSWNGKGSSVKSKVVYTHVAVVSTPDNPEGVIWSWHKSEANAQKPTLTATQKKWGAKLLTVLPVQVGDTPASEPDDDGDTDVPAVTARPLGGTVTKTGKKLVPGSPTALKVQLLYNTEFEDGAVMAVKKDTGERIVWDAKNKKVLRQKLVGNKYATTEALTKGAIYKKYNTEEGWTVPDEQAAQPSSPAVPVGKPLALKVQVLYNAKYAPGEVIAERVSSSERLVWNGKKIERQTWSPAAGKWETGETVTRGAAYKLWKDEQGWTSPTGAVGGLDAPALAPTPAVTAVGSDAEKYMTKVNDPAVPDLKTLDVVTDDDIQIKKYGSGIAVTNPEFDGASIKIPGAQVTQAAIDDAIATHLANNASAKAAKKAFNEEQQLAGNFTTQTMLAPHSLKSIRAALKHNIVKNGTTLYAVEDEEGPISIVKTDNGSAVMDYAGKTVAMTTADFENLTAFLKKFEQVEADVKASKKPFVKKAVPALKKAAPAVPKPITIPEGQLLVPEGAVEDMKDLAHNANFQDGDVLLESDDLTVEKVGFDGDHVKVTSKNTGESTLYVTDTLTANHLDDFADMNPAPAPSMTPAGIVPGPITYTKAQKIKKDLADPGVEPLAVLYSDADVTVIKGMNKVGITSKSGGGFQSLDAADITADILNLKINQAKAGVKTPAPAAVAVPAPVSTGALPDVSALKSTGQVVGTHGGKIYTDSATGKKYLFKASPAGFKAAAQADLVTAELHKAVGLPTPATSIVTLDGQQGSLQEFLPDLTEPFPFKLNPKGLTASQTLDIQKEHVFDWLVANHDAHGKNLLSDAEGNLVGIDKGQSFKWFGMDKLDWDFQPNEHPQAALQIYKAYAEGVPGTLLLDPSKGELAAFIKKIQSIPDDDYKALLRPYAEAAAAEGKLAVPGPSYLGLKKSSIPANDVEAFLDAAVARKNNLSSDITAFYNKAAAANAAKTGTPAGVNPPTVSTPLPTAKPQLPLKMSHTLLVNPKTTSGYKHGQVIAEHPANKERLIWNASLKKYQVQFQDPDTGQWATSYTYTKQGAYKNLANDAGWMTPTTQSVFPDAGASPGTAPAPSVSGNPIAPVVTAPKIQFDASKLSAQVSSTAHLTDDQRNDIYDIFRNKAVPGSKITLASTGEEKFLAALEARKLWNDANPGTPLTLLQILRAVDERAAAKANTTNTNKFENSVLDWLKTPEGTAAAPEVVGLSRLSAAEKKKFIADKKKAAEAAAILSGTADYQKVLSVPVTQPAVVVGNPVFQVQTSNEAFNLDKQMHGGIAGKNKWTTAQAKAVYDYTIDSTAMNNFMRTFGKDSAYVADEALALQSAMKPSPKKIHLYRNTYTAFGGAMGSPTLADIQKMAANGESFLEAGFSSTSIDKTVFSSGRPYRYDIEVPEGTPMVWAQQHTAHKNEQEFILGAGLKYLVLGGYTETVNGTKKTVIKVRVVPA